MSENISPEENARLSALKMLTRRALTLRELIDRLRRKGIDRNLAEDTAGKYLDSGYIDEESITEDHIRRGREDKFAGRFLLKHELGKRGINLDLIERVLNRLYPESDEKEIALGFALKKIKGMSDLSSETRDRRIGSALHRRGFNAETIAAVMHEISQIAL